MQGAVDQVFAANRAVGRVALDVEFRDGVSRRMRLHEAGSIRVRFPGAPAQDLEAILLNTAGGLAGGDRTDIDVRVGAGAALTLTSASAEKVYRSLGPDALLSVSLKVAQRARLAWLPREMILFDRSRLRRTIDVDLAEDAGLLLAEAVIFGRADMGEVVAQGHFFDRWRVRRGGKLIYAESIRLDGAIATKLEQAAVAAGCAAVATIMMVPGDATMTAALSECKDRFRGDVGISTWNGMSVARFCAPDGDSLRHDIVFAMTIMMRAPMPRLWLN